MIGEKLGNYRIVAKIGKGGMGAVYRAEHEVMGRQAAIKVLLPELSNRPDVVRRFFNEARATARLQHPALVQIYDCGTHEPTGSAYLIMDFLQGESLGRRLERETRLAIPTAIDFACQIAKGMAVAHRAGIVHRDLKPDNLFLVPHPGRAIDDVRILDFGVAKLSQARLDAPNTRTGALLGTPMYMAPEQCRGAADIDARADIYSLGCLMFAMVCGRPPFIQRQVGQLLAAHAEDPPPSPHEFVDNLPEGLAQEILKALEKDPDRRHQTMDEFAAAFEDPDLVNARARQGGRRSRESRPAMTELLPQRPRPPSRAPDESLVAPRAPRSTPREAPRVTPRSASSVSAAGGDPFSAPGATRVLPAFKPEFSERPESSARQEPSLRKEPSLRREPSPRREKGNTTIGDSPVEVPALGPIGRSRTLAAAALAALGLVVIVGLSLWHSLSTQPPPLPVEPARSLEQPPAFPSEPPETFEPPPLAPVAETPPPTPPLATPIAPSEPAAAPPRTSSARSSSAKKLPFAPIPFRELPSDRESSGRDSYDREPSRRDNYDREPAGRETAETYPSAPQPRYDRPAPESVAPSPSFAPQPRYSASGINDTITVSVSNPRPDLRVTVDGADARLPVRLPRDGRNHTLRFSRPGQQDEVREVTADQDQTLRLGNMNAPILE